MITNEYNQHYGRYKTSDGTIIEIVPSIADDHIKKVTKKKEPKNIYLEKGVYKIFKSIQGKRYTFGKYTTLEKAIRARNYFETKGWKNCISEKDKFSDVPEETKSYFESSELY